MKRNQQLETVLDELKDAGVVPDVHIRGHVQVRWLAPSGEPRVCVVAGSSRSATGVANARATVRRMLRQDGILR